MESLFIPLMILTIAAGMLVMRVRGKQWRIPWVTLAIALVTFVVGVLALFDPALLAAIGRDRDALAAGEWWRIITPLFGQDGGWFGLVFNLVALLVLGAIVELVIGWRMLLVTYFVSGFVSEVVAYTLLPDQGFAGNSVANFGLAGLIAVVAVARPFPIKLFGVFPLLFGVILLVAQNLHGVGIAVGALVGAVYVLVVWVRGRPRSARVAGGAT